MKSNNNYSPQLEEMTYLWYHKVEIWETGWDEHSI